MLKYIPVGWTEHELIAQLAYERSVSPLIDQLCIRFEEYLQECDAEMIDHKLRAKYTSKLQAIDNCITTSAECPICAAQLGLLIDMDAERLKLHPYKDIDTHRPKDTLLISTLLDDIVE